MIEKYENKLFVITLNLFWSRKILYGWKYKDDILITLIMDTSISKIWFENIHEYEITGINNDHIINYKKNNTVIKAIFEYTWL